MSHLRYTAPVVALLALAVAVPGGRSVPFVEATTSTGARAIFEPLPPARILNTRQAGQGPAVGAGQANVRVLQVTGQGGIPSDATAVVATVTAINPTARSYLTLYPNGQSRPDVSMLNFTAGSVVTNLVTVGIGTAGQVRIYNNAGSVHVIVDVTGYYRGHDHDDRYDIAAGTSIPVNADGTAAQNGSALLAAMAGITDASATKPYAVRLAPGVFDVGVNGLDVKPFVTLSGSGEGRSIVTAPGSPDLNSADGGVYGTLRAPGNSAVRDLTVRNTGGVSTVAVGLEVGEGTARLTDVTIEVGGSTDNVGITPNHFATSPRLDMDSGTVAVSDSGIGIGGLASSDDFDEVLVRNSRITVAGGGIAFDADTTQAGTSRSRVTNTEITVSGGGTGIGGTSSNEMVFDGVTVTVTGGVTAFGVAGTGATFRPTLHQSTISVSGASASNKGFDVNEFFVVTLQRSRVTVTGTNAVGMELGFGAANSGSAFVDGSVLQATTVFSSLNADTEVKVGASRLHGTLVASGAGSFVCVASYRSDYSAIGINCI